jgi:hypothetical protein
MGFGSWAVGGCWWRCGFVGVVGGVVADAVVVDAVADGFVDADTSEHDSALPVLPAIVVHHTRPQQQP